MFLILNVYFFKKKKVWKRWFSSKFKCQLRIKKYCQLIFVKGVNRVQWGKIEFSTNGSPDNWITTSIKINLDPCLRGYKKINSRWDYRSKCKLCNKISS